MHTVNCDNMSSNEYNYIQAPSNSIINHRQRRYKIELAIIGLFLLMILIIVIIAQFKILPQ